MVLNYISKKLLKEKNLIKELEDKIKEITHTQNLDRDRKFEIKYYWYRGLIQDTQQLAHKRCSPESRKKMMVTEKSKNFIDLHSVKVKE